MGSLGSKPETRYNPQTVWIQSFKHLGENWKVVMIALCFLLWHHSHGLTGEPLRDTVARPTPGSETQSHSGLETLGTGESIK